jgi:hypothetical protein
MLFFSDDKTSPLMCERGISSSQGRIGVTAIVEDLPIESLQRGAEHGAGVEIDRCLCGTKTEDEFVLELLLTTSK